jgi:hypothetical protein
MIRSRSGRLHRPEPHAGASERTYRRIGIAAGSGELARAPGGPRVGDKKKLSVYVVPSASGEADCAVS